MSDYCTKHQARSILTDFCELQRCDVRMHFLSITEVFPPKLKTDEKKQALTLQRVDEYNQCILDSHMLLPAGPFSLVDMHHLTRGMRCAALRCKPALLHISSLDCMPALLAFVTQWLHIKCVVNYRSISCCLQMQVQHSLHLYSSHEHSQMLILALHCRLRLRLHT